MNQGLVRILTALVGIPLIVYTVYVGDWVFFAFIALISLVAQMEFVYMLRRMGWQVSLTWSWLLSLSWLCKYFVEWWQTPLLIVVMLFAASTIYTGVRRSIERFAGTLASMVYPVIMMSFMIDIHWQASQANGLDAAFLIVLMLLCLIWATDTGAYYAGRTLGKHKLAPSISPNKTWEGTIGGVVLAIATATLFKTQWIPELSWVDVVVFAFLAGVWGQIGDLLESAFKRAAGVKDSASILPGHGGILDRFDSIIFTAPVYYLYLSELTSLLAR